MGGIRQGGKWRGEGRISSAKEEGRAREGKERRTGVNGR